MASSIFFLYFLISAIIALLIDEIFGEPKNRHHPVAWLGHLIEVLDKRLHSINSGIPGGTILLVLVLLISLSVAFLILRAASLNIIFWILASAVIFKFTFASRSMGDHIIPVVRHLKNSDIYSARKALSMMVRRKTEDLSESMICSALIETISEGYVDGFLSPVFYFGFFGVIGAVAARAINTLDSMVGYKNMRYLEFGRASAKADTVMNFIPARFSSLIFILVHPSGRAKVSPGRIKIESKQTESLNAGWPMSTMAFLLGVRLAKEGSYVINNGGREPGIEDVMLALRIFQVSVLIGMLFSLLIAFLIQVLILSHVGLFF